VSRLADASARVAAVDPRRSFIVQAPAGSGKTGLLIQRYLALLATVDHPEEVIAITFTRKATGEMRERVLEALAEARARVMPEEGHARATIELARAVVARDADRGWDIHRQPARLRLLTIDALCGWLSRRLPLRSGLAARSRVTDDARALYEQAAALTLELLEEETPWAEPVSTLLAHLDNDLARCRAMLVEMLGRRDQWLRLIGAPGGDRGERRAALEAALHRVCVDRLAALQRAIPAALRDELAAVCGYAGERLSALRPEHPGASCAGLAALPPATPQGLAAWQGIEAILLTAKGAWRKAFSVREGFARDDEGAREMKRRALQLCAALAGAKGLRTQLAGLASLPPPAYADAQWHVLDALIDVLRISAATLTTVFAERATLDHIEVASAARTALGTEQAPSDLALALDHRVRHLLVDEFQDTSHGQYELLCRLTAGWTGDDGRTLFLVGDPMQSIYRFREADVGLYQHARAGGIGQVRLEPLVLESNFRSRPAIVEWANRSFPGVLGQRDDGTTGAVAYRASVAVRDPGDAREGVSVHLLETDDAGAEDSLVAALASAALERRPHGTVAILVRARTHLARLLPALREAGVAYRGVDVEPLAEVPVVQDLIALASAALAPHDRSSWLAVLRAPWCGLRLADLHALVDGAPTATVGALLRDPERLGRLTPDACERLGRVAPVLLALAAGARRGRLARRIEGAWQALGGPACVDEHAHFAAERCIALLHATGDELLGAGIGELRRRVSELYAQPDPAARAVEVMTIHKAKGLEFDTVVIPGLARRPRPDGRVLLAWTRRAAGPEAGDLLLAPLPSPAGGEPALYDFVRGLEAQKTAHESARLLYVATTRARDSLQLVATLRPGVGDDAPTPPSGSLLALLWPDVTRGAERASPSSEPPGARTLDVAGRGEALRPQGRGEEMRPQGRGEEMRPQGRGEEMRPQGRGQALRRLPARWQAPAPAAPVRGLMGERLPEPAVRAEPVEFDWAGRLARHVGTVVHSALREMALDGVDAWSCGRLRERRPSWSASLRALGVGREHTGEALARIEAALARVLGDARARWLLDPSHRQPACELAVSGVVGGRVVRVVVDRTFVDDQGMRWIVDYKTGRHEGGSLERFLDREQERYRPQLERYGVLLASMGPEPVCLALYFPVSGGWREWPPGAGGEAR
jgi:ATP-dependent exoDNAse (exonuclease V) beta subunit